MRGRVLGKFSDPSPGQLGEGMNGLGWPRLSRSWACQSPGRHGCDPTGGRGSRLSAPAVAGRSVESVLKARTGLPRGRGWSSAFELSSFPDCGSVETWLKISLNTKLSLKPRVSAPLETGHHVKIETLSRRVFLSFMQLCHEV